MKKLLFGGSFNPPTIAHYEMIEYLSKQNLYDEIIILPNGDSYEFGGKTLNNFHHRVAMLHLMCDHLPKVRILEIENQEHFRGTAHTLKVLNHPTFVLGADCLENLHRWKNFPSLISENNFLVFSRGNDINVTKMIQNNPHLSPYYHHFKFENMQISNVSSSEFRETKNSKLVTQEVFAYIKIHHLYGL